jgi:mono/diheme cytochrome c family protein
MSSSTVNPILAILLLQLAAAEATGAAVSFANEVLPLLEQHCNKCHHPEEARAGLDLTRVSTILRGGDELGPAALPLTPDKSPLLMVLSGGEPAMPENGQPLPPEDIALLRRWIAEGANDDTPSFPPTDVAFFERSIRPLLFKNCFKCHAGDAPEAGLRLGSRHGILAGGERGPAVVPGHPEQSRLIAAVRHQGELKMPRGGDRLTDGEIAALEEWVRRDLPWPGDQQVLTRKKLFTISEADRQHWAFRPLPRSLSKDWSINQILAREHAERGILPSRPAGKHRLLRRVTYDLIGYPPTPGEITAFLSDKSPSAFETVVDRLLKSSLFGNRWGRHWLDHTRNGANGQSNRGPTMDSARYEDWVTRCFNEDRPWDWFARVHLAGDRIPDFKTGRYSIDQAIAAAVPLNGARTFQNAATDTFVLMDKLDEGIEFMGRSLLGISLECARCHDHKFDPISQRDYYGLLGFFQSSWFDQVPLSSSTVSEADQTVENRRSLLSEQAILDGRIRVEGTRISSHGGELRRKWYAARQGFLAPKDRRIAELEAQILRAELKAALHAKAAKPSKGTKGGSRAVRDLQQELANREASLADFTPRFFDRRTMKELGYELRGEKTTVGLITRAEKADLPEVVAELKVFDRLWKDEIAEWVHRHRFGSFLKTDPEAAQLAAWDDRVQAITAELQRLATDTITVRCEGGLEPFKAAAKADKRQFYPGLVPAFVGNSRLLRRGDVLEPDKLIPRGFPEFFGTDAPALTGSGRPQLAEWLTASNSIQSALLARAAVNRAWQHLFGTGLCRTPKELGRLGSIPELPELLDGLASRFSENGWSHKQLVREIILSDAYQSSVIELSRSAPSSNPLSPDPGNLFFARQNISRLELEPIMNTMAYHRHGQRFAGTAERNAHLNSHGHFTDHFDGPTTDEIIDRRTASISATQALFLMNNAGGARVIASGLSTRLRTKAKPELVDLLEKLYLVVYQRPPTESEQIFAANFDKRWREQNGAVNQVEEFREYTHLLLCSNELIYIE